MTRTAVITLTVFNPETEMYEDIKTEVEFTLYVGRIEPFEADELVEEMASFPNGDHDDLVDSTSQALLRFRQGGFMPVYFLHL